MKEYFGGLVRTSLNTWEKTDKIQYKDSIVFIEDSKQIWSNNEYYGAIKRVKFDTSNVTLKPNTMFYNYEDSFNLLNISIIEGEESDTYFIEFLCNNTSIALPSYIHWKYNVVPDFSKNNVIMTVMIQDDTAYLIDVYNDEYIDNTNYLTFTALGDSNTLSFSRDTNDTIYPVIEYSFDKKIWNEFSENVSVSIPKNTNLYCRGINHNGLSFYDNGVGTTFINKFTGTGKFDISGNLNTLIDYKNINTVLNNSGVFSYLFGEYRDINCVDVVNSKDLILSQNLSPYCYWGMFVNCNSLTTAPELPATILTDSCYQRMFSGCSSLTAAPELPATTLANYCYNNMFSGCSSLTAAPELPATTLANYCYYRMFDSCSSLTTAPEILPATTLANYCYEYMFGGCSSLTITPELPATELVPYCYNYMFSDCTSLTTALVLPATTLVEGCYERMFQGCTSLTEAPELPATTLADRCYYSMFSGCTSLTEAPELPATRLANDCYNYMFEDCTNLSFIKCLAFNGIMSNNGYNTEKWTKNVNPNGTFIKYIGTIWQTGEDGVPENWTINNVQ